MTYQAAPNHDNEAAFTAPDPQPRSAGIQYPRQRFAADGTVYADGTPTVVWLFNVLKPAQYEALLGYVGLTVEPDVSSAECTIATVAYDRSTFVNLNAIVMHRKGTDATFRAGLWRDVKFTFRYLGAT